MAVHERRISVWLRHAHTPGVQGFAMLASMEAAARGILISVFPVAMYQALGDAETVSEIYFLIGLGALTASLFVPMLAKRFARRRVYTAGGLLMASGAGLAAMGGQVLTPLGLCMMNMAVVTTFICFNAYVLDYIERASLGEVETQRLFYSGLAWTAGPVLGVWLTELWRPAPFLLSMAGALCMVGLFWWMRLSDGGPILKARRHAASPLSYLPRFFAQPRLVAGWLFAVIRSSAWWVYVVYLPIYAVENGYSESLGGVMLSGTNALLFLTPLMLRWMRRNSVRVAVRTGFLGAALFFAFAWGAAQGAPTVALSGLALATLFLILLDISGGLPFLMAVRPHERTEMSVVYASFRDVSGILTPGAVRLVLFVSPLSGVFLATAAALGVAWALASTLHPRLGRARVAAE